MKNLLTAMTAVGVLTGAAIAQDVVTSVNIVGYKKHTVEAGKLYMVSSQFQSIDGSAITPETAIGDQLPYGSQVFYWDHSAPTPVYQGSERVTNLFFNGWDGALTLDGTKGFWLIPGGAPASTYDVAFLGEVPLRESFTNMVPKNALMMTSYPYTADVSFSNTALYANSVVGDQLYWWNPAIDNYVGYESVSNLFFEGWDNGGEEWLIPQGTGFWYIRADVGDALLTIADTRPYTP